MYQGKEICIFLECQQKYPSKQTNKHTKALKKDEKNRNENYETEEQTNI